MTVRGAFGWHAGGRCAATGKVRFGPSAAQQKIGEMRLTDPEGHLLNSYRCDACRWWHVGHDRRPRGINALRSELCDVYPTLEEQDAWLDAPHPLLGGDAAGDLVGTDREAEVWALVDQLRSGAVV